LTESFILWRNAQGGPGVPGESAPGDSGLPGGENNQSEEEILEVILDLFDAGAPQPRTWGDEEHGGGH
jgi:hypothetical protein